MRQRSTSEEEAEIEEEERQRKRKRRHNNSKHSKHREQDDNIHMMEMKALRALAEHEFKFRVQRADKRGATVISEGRMHAESRAHVEDDKAYELASGFGSILGMRPEGMRKYQGAIVDGQQTEWSSTLDSIPEGIDKQEGKWENEQEVIDRLWERMEWFFLKVMPKKYEELPSTILTNL
jgi:hypothetical protein